MSSPLSLRTLITVLLLPSATARLTTLITEDQITAPLREAAFRRFDTLPPTHPVHRFQLPYLLTCNRCISIYAAAALLATLPFPSLRFIPRTLALSQLALTTLDATDLLLAPRHPAADFDFTLPDPAETTTDPTDPETYAETDQETSPYS